MDGEYAWVVVVGMMALLALGQLIHVVGGHG